MSTGHKRDYLFKFVSPETRSHIKLDDEAAYSVTDQYTADRMTRDIMRFVDVNAVVCDATACIGGNTHSFARAFRHVVAIEQNPTRFEYLKHNMGVLQIKNVQCVCGDALEEVPWHLAGKGHRRPYNVIFVDPPWGGPDYKEHERLSLYLGDLPLAEVCKQWAHLTTYIAIKTPINFDESAFRRDTSDCMELVFKNNRLRKILFYIFECKA